VDWLAYYELGIDHGHILPHNIVVVSLPVSHFILFAEPLQADGMDDLAGLLIDGEVLEVVGGSAQAASVLLQGGLLDAGLAEGVSALQHHGEDHQAEANRAGEVLALLHSYFEGVR
jgi:hypothetical protein